MNRTASLLLSALLLLPGAGADGETLTTRLWSSPESIRLVLETDKPVDYSISGLEEPPRLVVDILSPDGEVESLAKYGVRTEYVSGVRASRRDAGTLRVVFDLSAAINYQVTRIKPVAPYRHRLVVDVKPQNPPDPLLALIEKLGAVDKPFVVLIDPGHGGEDPGAVSPNGNYEKGVVLRLAELLAEDINRRPAMKALLTRDSDRFIPLFERVRIAQRLNVDAFVSMHADSVKNQKARGSSVFILSKKGASTKFAKRMAESANLSDLVGGLSRSADPTLDSALRQFSKDGKDRASRQLAGMMLKEIGEINRLHSERVESAGFAVLKSPSIPSVLVETAFISNPVEEKKLLDSAFQRRLVAALGDALQNYRDKYHVRP